MYSIKLNMKFLRYNDKRFSWCYYNTIFCICKVIFLNFFFYLETYSKYDCILFVFMCFVY